MYQQVIVPTVTYGAETWGLREAERSRLNVFEMKCLRPVIGVTRWDRIRNEEIRRRAGIKETLAEKVERRMLQWFEHVERMEEGRWPKKVKAAKVESRQGRGRPWFGWLDGVKKALAVREVGLQEATHLARDRSVLRELVRA